DPAFGGFGLYILKILKNYKPRCDWSHGLGDRRQCPRGRRGHGGGCDGAPLRIRCWLSRSFMPGTFSQPSQCSQRRHLVAHTGETAMVNGNATPPGSGPRWRLVGPGLIAAATGVGAGDLVATLVAGSRFGYTLLWAAVFGCVLKIILVESVGRWYLAGGETLFHGWRSLGRWTTVYFGIYVVIWGFVYGATAMSSTALPLAALFPAVDLKVFAVLSGLMGLALVWGGSYALFEKLIAALVGIMFVAVVGSALVVAPNLADIAGGLVPRMPPGSLFYVLGLAGGVGGSIT